MCVFVCATGCRIRGLEEVDLDVVVMEVGGVVGCPYGGKTQCFLYEARPLFERS